MQIELGSRIDEKKKGRHSKRPDQSKSGEMAKLQKK